MGARRAWSRSCPLHPCAVQARPVRLNPTEGISKSRTYSLRHFSQRSAKTLPWSSACEVRWVGSPCARCWVLCVCGRGWRDDCRGGKGNEARNAVSGKS